MRFVPVIRGDEHVVVVSGKIEAGVSADLRNVTQFASTPKLVFDMAAVGSINSPGAVEWSKGLAFLLDAYEITLVNCTVAFVDYCNFFPSMIGTDHPMRMASMRSFAVPYYCVDCNHQMASVVETEAIRGAGGQIPQHQCVKCARMLDSEVLAEDYLVFLTRRTD